MKTHSIKLISKYADIDVQFTGIVAESARDAADKCLRYMAVPDAWLSVHEADADQEQGEQQS